MIKLKKTQNEFNKYRQTTKIQLQRSQNKLAALSDWIQACNSTIETLQNSVKEKDTNLATVEEDLKRELTNALKLIQDNEAAEAKISKLQATIITLKSKKKSTVRKIRHLNDLPEGEDATAKTRLLQLEIESKMNILCTLA